MSLFRLVTVEAAKANSVYDSDADDAKWEQIVDDASQFVMNYLEAEWSRVRQYLDDPDVDVLDEEIAAYERAFGGWTDSSGFPLVDSNGDPLLVDTTLDSNGDEIGGHSIIPGPVHRATLLVTAVLLRHPHGDVDPITPAVKSLLVRFRPPTVA
jgi:hypothetical protein